MARTYRMTPGRKAALRKAQLASARKRKGHGHVVPGAVRIGIAGTLGFMTTGVATASGMPIARAVLGRTNAPYAGALVGPYAIATGVIVGAAINQNIKGHNKRVKDKARRLARRATGVGKKAQKGRRIKR